MTTLDQATLVCSHVLKDVAAAGFVCNTISGWAAGCSEECLERSGPNSLGMVCLGHLTNIPDLPRWFYETPPNFAFQHLSGRWHLDYYETDDEGEGFELPEHSLIGAPHDSLLRAMPCEVLVTAIILPDKTLAVLNFEETGLRSIPFWTAPELPSEMLEKLDGTETISEIPLQHIRDFAIRNSIRFLLANNLVGRTSFVLLANEGSQ
ncbi:hypothetical protein [Yoonia sp. BS5-3]|uniref:Uncharacterized protein n=1 Tax=Yoonia phaeophyticola TaxID=3137369 RepID=A0ABZ2V8A8_9RHOB